MSNGLSQISLRYDPQEDRVLFLFTTRDRKEYQLWLTRQLVLRGLWPLIQKALRSGNEVRDLIGEEAKKAMVSFQHQTSLDRKAFTKDFDNEGMERPLGDEPVVVTGIKANASKKGVVLVYQLKNGTEIALNYDPKLLHNFCKLLINAVNRSTWDSHIGFETGFEQQTPAEHRLH